MVRSIRTVPHKRSSSGATETYEFNCTIENISRFDSDNLNDVLRIYVYEQYGHVLTFFTQPDEVTPGDKKPAEFVLRFDPGDYNSENLEFIFMVSPLSLRATPSLEILFTQSVVKANGEKRALASKEKLSGPGKIKVTKIRRDELLNPVNGFVTKDSITLHHEVILRNKSGLGDQLQDSQLEPLAKSFADLLQSGAHSDVIFVLVDDGGDELHAHKAILAARSQMFADMFALCTADSSPDPIEIVKTRVEVFKQALNFIYTDSVGGSLDGTAHDLLICADKFQLDPLKSICEDYLVGSITGESDLLELYELAKRTNAQKLQAKVLDLLRDSDLDDHLSKMCQMKRQLSSLEAAAAANPKTKKSKRSN